MSNCIHVNNVDQIPESEHYALFENGSIYIPGDERSQRSPGHGYPAHSNHFVTYKAFLNIDDLKAELTNLHSNGRKGYRAVKISPVSVNINIEVL